MAELHTQPAFGKKTEGLPQANTKVALRLVDSGAFFYGNSTDFNKYYPFSNWGTEQVLGEPHDLYTGDALLDISSGYASSVNTGQSKYPNDTGIGINVKSETPEPFNLLLISEVYV